MKTWVKLLLKLVRLMFLPAGLVKELLVVHGVDAYFPAPTVLYFNGIFRDNFPMRGKNRRGWANATLRLTFQRKNLRPRKVLLRDIRVRVFEVRVGLAGCGLPWPRPCWPDPHPRRRRLALSRRAGTTWIAVKNCCHLYRWNRRNNRNFTSLMNFLSIFQDKTNVFRDTEKVLLNNC